jgi:hypothetical protein
LGKRNEPRHRALSRLYRPLAGALAGAAAWCSVGQLALEADANRTLAFGLTPHPAWLIGAIAAGAAGAAFCRAPRTSLLLLTGSIVLPWVAVVSGPTLLWQGVLTCYIWLLIGLDLLLSVRRDDGETHGGWRTAGVAVVMLLAVALLTNPLRVSGDEPHYLIVASSLLHDGDIDVANDYDAQRHSFYGGSLEPRHTVPTPSGRQYSFHGLGTSLLVLPAFAAGGVLLTRIFLALCSAFGAFALWTATRTLSTTGAAHAALASLLLQVPFAAQAAGIYPDGPAAMITSLALWTLVRLERGLTTSTPLRVTTSVALSILPWLHLRLVVVAVVFWLALVAASIRHDRHWRGAVVLSAAPAVMAALWWTTSVLMFGTFDPTAPFREKAAGSWTGMPTGILGLLFDHEYGLLPYAPVLALGMAGLVRLRREAPLTAAACVTAVALTAAIGGAYVWWGGTSTPARFLVPVLPALALGVGAWWAAARAATRGVAVGLILLGTTFLIAGVSDERGLFMSGVPDARDSIFERVQPLVDVPAALPSLFRAGTSTTSEAGIALVWSISALLTFALFRAVISWRRSSEDSWALAPWFVVLWIAGSTTAAWSIRGMAGPTPARSQLALLQDSGARWRSAGMISPLRFASADAALSRLSFDAPGRRGEALIVPGIPAGTYQIDSSAVPEAGVVLSLELGREAWPAWKWRASSTAESPILTLAVAVHSLTVRAEPVRTFTGGVRLKVLARAGDGSSGEMAERVTRYGGDRLVYSLDDATSMETGGFRVAAGRSGRILIADLNGRSSPTLLRVEAEGGTARFRITSESADDVAAALTLNVGSRQDVTIPPSQPPRVLRLANDGNSSVWLTVSALPAAPTASGPTP